MLTTQEQIDAILAKLQQLDERLTIINSDFRLNMNKIRQTL